MPVPILAKDRPVILPNAMGHFRAKKVLRWWGAGLFGLGALVSYLLGLL